MSLLDIRYKIDWWVQKYINPSKWSLVWEAITGNPWDPVYLYRIERRKLEEMLHYYELEDRVHYEGEEQQIRELRWMIYLLYIMEENDVINPHGLNYKNIHRFVDKDQKYFENTVNWYKKWPSEYYILKATHLYYKLRLECTGKLWV